jgi:flagellar hook-associated protein 2
MGISLNPATLLSGQGINVSSLVNEILAESSGQLTEWEGEQSTLQTQSSALTGINSDLSNLATAVSALSDPLGVLVAPAAVSSDTSVLTATAQTSAVAGNHSIVVTSLASNGTLYTNDFPGGASATILPSGATSGEISLQIGGSAGTTQAIAITPGGNDTLATLAQYINGQNLGVNASVVTDANGSRLALVSQNTGTPGALAITSNNTNLSFNAPAGGTNASLTIDGIPYSSATNTVTGAIPGVTLNLANSAPDDPVQLTVGPDTTQVTAAVNNFVSAYNQLINDINQQFSVNTATNSEGPLGSDSSLRQLQSSLLADVTYAAPGSAGYTNLAALGINMNDDGTLTVDSTQLASTLSSNPSAFFSFFQNSTQTGFADAFNKDLTNLTNPTEGVLNLDLAENATQQQDLSNSISNFEVQLTSEQTQLTAQFSQVDASLQAYPLLLQEITATLGTLDSGSSNNTGSSSPTLTSGL